MEIDNKRRLAEKVCLMYLMREKNKKAAQEIERIRNNADKEKEDLVNSLRSMYYQLSKLNNMEAQAVEAAKNRGAAHLSTLMGTAKVLKNSTDLK